jgi:hypothetical protein
VRITYHADNALSFTIGRRRSGEFWLRTGRPDLTQHYFPLTYAVFQAKGSGANGQSKVGSKLRVLTDTATYIGDLKLLSKVANVIHSSSSSKVLKLVNSSDTRHPLL